MLDGSGPVRPATRDGFLHTMADGTLKQTSPFTGTQVWTVPGRADRPLGNTAADPEPLDATARTATCAFCSDRYLDTPPERSRVVRDEAGWRTLRGLPAADVFDTVAELRRIPNLYEILPVEYWRANYGYAIPEMDRRRMVDYLADVAGREHVLRLLKTKIPAERRSGVGDDALLEREAGAFFGGTHDVIVARRHYTDDARDDSQLASSGTLQVDEHRRYTEFAIESMRELYADNPFARWRARGRTRRSTTSTPSTMRTSTD